MPAKHIITGQKLTPEKLQRAKELRQQMTEAEKVLWQRLRTDRLDGWHFRRQQVIAGFIVDFYCHAASLAVEVDGPVHARQADDDHERDRVLADHGVRVLRLRNHEVFEDTEDVCERILALCAGDSEKNLSAEEDLNHV